jgi:hypothetical protein
LRIENLRFGNEKACVFPFLNTKKEIKGVAMKRAKILLVSKHKEDLEVLEKAFESFVREGGEILVTDKEEKGLQLLISEKPELLFLDEACMRAHEEQWIQIHTHMVLIQETKEQHSEEFLTRPLNGEQLVLKAQQVFPHLDAPPVIPI